MSNFVTPSTDPVVGELVWHFDGGRLLGPHYVLDIRTTGFGSNKRKLWVLFDTEESSWHYCERRWLKVPMETK